MKCPAWLFFTSEIHLQVFRYVGSSPQNAHGIHSCGCPPLWSEESLGARCFLVLFLWLDTRCKMLPHPLSLFWTPGLPACLPTYTNNWSKTTSACSECFLWSKSSLPRSILQSVQAVVQAKVPFAIHHSPEVLSSLNLKSAEEQLLLLEAILTI